MSEPAAAVVHVTNGDSVSYTLARTDLGGEVITWRDIVCEGPIADGDAAAVREGRATFLADAWQGDREAILADLEDADAALMAALDDGRETVLWFEHDLHDQLQLIQILTRIAGHPRRGAVRMITLDRFPGHPRFGGLGELSSDELITLWPQRAELEPAAFASASRAWVALQKQDRATLAELATGDAPGLPYLAAALRRLLEERPWAGSRLGRSERQILRAVEAGARTPIAVFQATMRMEEAPYSGDTWIFKLIDDLSAGSLLSATSGGLELTAEGRAALG